MTRSVNGASVSEETFNVKFLADGLGITFIIMFFVLVASISFAFLVIASDAGVQDPSISPCVRCDITELPSTTIVFELWQILTLSFLLPPRTSITLIVLLAVAVQLFASVTNTE